MTRTLTKKQANFNRAERAQAAVRVHALHNSTLRDGQYTCELVDVVRDLLADLMHYCEREECRFDEALEAATEHFYEERES